MLHGAVTFSDMYSNNLKWGIGSLVCQIQDFLSLDDVHKHFRMAAFSELSVSGNGLRYDELSLEGDHSGIQSGLILSHN